MLATFLVGLFSFVFLNIPIAFSLILVTLVLMYFMGNISPLIIAQSVMRGIDNFPLLAIPFFILAGDLMNVGGISRRIVEFSRTILGHVRGGLGYVAVVASMIFAGVSGSAAADTSAIGSILLPIMAEEGYDKPKSTALITSAGCIGPIIPPSIPMILFGVIGGVSIVKLFLGGIIPGILIGCGLMIGWYFHSRKHNYPRGERASLVSVWRATRKAFWALILPIIILGGIIFGIYTPTEAAVVAVVYAFVVGLFIYQELRLGDLPHVLVQSAKSTAIVLMVCGAAMAAAYLLTIAQIPPVLTATILRLSGGQPWLIIFWINVLLLLVGCVMDLTPALLILAPILLPIAVKFGFDPVYFGVVMCVNLCIGLITPPVGTVLYIGCGLSKLPMGTLSRAIVLNISIMIAVLFLITYVPWTITFIPRMVGR